MDIVFQPNGNFDEVYLYVSDGSLLPCADIQRRLSTL